MKKKNAIEVAEEYGIDLSLLWDNLRQSPTERAIRHQHALDLYFFLKEAGENARQRKNVKSAVRKRR